MLLSRQDAAEAVRKVERTQARSLRMRWYEHASPHFILWGVLWVIAYTLCDLYPRNGGLVWLVTDVVGLSASAWFARKGDHAWQFPAVVAVLVAFFLATFAVLAPINGRQIGAFITLVFATGYALLGIWCGLRFVAAGVALAALTLGGFFLLPTHFMLWMGLVGGGALISFGLWLRWL